MPVGRRVAQWRTRRRMTQQVFADRIGKSKSWVEKVERGIRKLDKFSVIQHIAEVLHIDPAELLDGQEQSPVDGSKIDGLEKLKSTLVCHATFNAHAEAPYLPKPGEIQRQIEHAWMTYGHGDYLQLLRILPKLLTISQQLHALHPEAGAEPLVQANRVASSVLVKLDEAHLAWIAADRAIVAAGNDRVLAAAAALSLTQALRALCQNRLALATALAAAHHIAQPSEGTESAEQASVYGALLLQAALAAASNNDPATVKELLRQAADLARQNKDHETSQRRGFNQTTVELTQIVTRASLGETRLALTQHEKMTKDGMLLHLPAEHRAAYLLDISRTYLQVGDMPAAGRALKEACRITPAGIRHAPSARLLVAEISRREPGPSDLHGLAASIGLTR
ncbi:helix-turn-helix domain-containing protein [Micromonospora sp. NBC_01813]|uniref:helix-turn-helix domain-containing protein n=1 Tax=Micromonospora sp. NBC_01813 TaxID=2975988 RepID=UPI002DD9F84C|nr:helix-turn-helix transcriptional regulator [Micromonospora sp. NBC_01813]WSA12755.1 helix-turn-helix domain-containing protein [Micromonospora sp. NBC_01813]